MRHLSLRGPIALAVVLLTVAGCTGVPHSSQPEVVGPAEAAGNQQAAGPTITPVPGDDPRNIVSGFLKASVLSDAGHSAARQFLTPAARPKWRDSTVIVVDDYRIPVPESSAAGTLIANVTGRLVGQLDARGVFTPVLKNNGVGEPQTFSFVLTKTGSDWRIDQVPAGVLIKKLDFQTYFRPRPLYFFNAAETQLVPDLRYSPADGQALANWLRDQMIGGPRPELLASVLNEIPSQVDQRRIAVNIDNRIQVEMPGALQVDPDSRRRLAAQLAYIFGPISFSLLVRITDGGTAVDIPGIGQDFAINDFDSVGPNTSQTQIPYYYLSKSGAVIDGLSGKAVPGRVGDGQYSLNSIAVHPVDGTTTRVVGVNGTRVLIGTVQAGLASVKLTARFVSRPEWQPGTNFAWVGTDHGLYRIGSDQVARPVTIAASGGGLPDGDVLALRFSSDGARLAVVLGSVTERTGAVWIGSVVRSGNDISVGSWGLVTPAALQVSDVSWASNPTALTLIGRDTSSGNGDRGVWQVQSDGSLLEQLTTSGLPGVAQTITSAPGQFSLVSTGNTIWILRNNVWSSLDGTGSTAGDSPVYAP
jgi:hypothetical protein